MEPAAATYLSQFPQQIFSKGSYIARQGEAVEYIYYLAEGCCVRNNFTVKGDEVIYEERFGGPEVSSLIGALTLYCPVIIHQTNFIAKSTCLCHKIYYKDFLEFLSLYPSVLHELLRMSMSSYQNLNANFYAKQRGQAPCRVCSFLLENVKSFGGNYILDKRFSISEIARYLGMHRITVNKIILALCAKGCCKYTDMGLLISDRALLQDYANGDIKLVYKKIESSQERLK